KKSDYLLFEDQLNICVRKTISKIKLCGESTAYKIQWTIRYIH
ncbi:MAG: hypothetical protein ACI9A7_001544, partial [Cyclobacteriaceae bacterium]